MGTATSPKSQSLPTCLVELSEAEEAERREEAA